jgi:hypothetical protein
MPETPPASGGTVAVLAVAGVAGRPAVAGSLLPSKVLVICSLWITGVTIYQRRFGLSPPAAP